MARIVEQPALRAELSAGALRQAAEFTWDRTAERTVEVYRQAAQAMRDDLAQLPA
jgi:D-inositol-3-phosphate glycosyltransferase